MFMFLFELDVFGEGEINTLLSLRTPVLFATCVILETGTVRGS